MQPRSLSPLMRAYLQQHPDQAERLQFAVFGTARNELHKILVPLMTEEQRARSKGKGKPLMEGELMASHKNEILGGRLNALLGISPATLAPGDLYSCLECINTLGCMVHVEMFNAWLTGTATKKNQLYVVSKGFDAMRKLGHGLIEGYRARLRKLGFPVNLLEGEPAGKALAAASPVQQGAGGASASQGAAGLAHATAGGSRAPAAAQGTAAALAAAAGGAASAAAPPPSAAAGAPASAAAHLSLLDKDPNITISQRRRLEVICSDQTWRGVRATSGIKCGRAYYEVRLPWSPLLLLFFPTSCPSLMPLLPTCTRIIHPPFPHHSLLPPPSPLRARSQCLARGLCAWAGALAPPPCSWAWTLAVLGMAARAKSQTAAALRTMGSPSPRAMLWGASWTLRPVALPAWPFQRMAWPWGRPLPARPARPSSPRSASRMPWQE